MERLTRRDRGGDAMLNCDNCDEKGRGHCGILPCRNQLIKALAAYEDTGLTPEEITQMTKTKSIPICVMERAIKGIDAAQVCDQAGLYDYELRRALKTVLEWYRAPIYRTEVYVSKRDGWLPKWWPEAVLAKEAGDG